MISFSASPGKIPPAMNACHRSWPSGSDTGSNWVRQIGGQRLLVDGSFVTAKQQPKDVDAVVLLPADFEARVEQGNESALSLERMLLSRHPEEIFAAEDEADWNEWLAFFGRTREVDGRRKGLVEIEL